MPSSSVIIPTYNETAYLRMALDSILSQTTGDFEAIVVDDGSTDNTRSVVERYGPRVKYVRQKNQGPSAARQAGFLQAGGEILSFLDSDDLWFPDTLSRQRDYLRDHPEADMVFGHMDVIDKDGRLIPERTLSERTRYARAVEKGITYENNALNCAFHFNTCAIRRKSLERLGGFDVNIRACEDGDFFMRAAAQIKIGFLDGDPLARFRVHDGGLGFERFNQAVIQLLEKHLALVETKKLPVNIRVASRNLRLSLSTSCFMFGKKSDGRKYYLSALARDPSALLSIAHLRIFILSFVPDAIKNSLRPGKAL